MAIADTFLNRFGYVKRADSNIPVPSFDIETELKKLENLYQAGAELLKLQESAGWRQLTGAIASLIRDTEAEILQLAENPAQNIREIELKHVFRKALAAFLSLGETKVDFDEIERRIEQLVEFDQKIKQGETTVSAETV